MANMELLSALSDIDRALGMIEGVAGLLLDNYASVLFDAVTMIDEAMKKIRDEDSK